MARTGILPPTKRLLTKVEAAGYCGLSPEAFARVCPIRAISLAPPNRDDTRLHRYDVVQLDGWIDRIGGGEQSSSLKEAIFRKMGI